MKKPAFWDKQNSFLQKLLTPLGCLYAYCVRMRFKKNVPYQPKVPVICVGNISVGGTGKTPVCLKLAEWFQKNGYKVVFLNHGYKSRLQNVIVDLERHTIKDVGDEALLLAKYAPTVIDQNRGRGVATAEKLKADIIIMDDGFQNPTVIKTMSLIVFDGEKGLGNGACLPAGPLRESLKQGLKRADAVIIVGEDKTNLEGKIRKQDPFIPILSGTLIPERLKIKKIEKAIAFAGIGRPEKFFDMLKREGILLEKTYLFSDHHVYKERELKEILNYKGFILTTSKDAVKLPQNILKKVTIIEVSFVFKDEFLWDAFLKKGIQ